jgi:putative multiple sugar transport system permease protein
LREYGLLFALIAVMAFFQIVTDGTLLRAVNVTNLLLQNSYIIIMALGMLVVIVSGNIDLSVGSVMGFIGALAAVMIVNWISRSPHRSRSAWSPARHRRGAGLLGRLLEDPVLHRDACRHAGVSRPVAVAARRPVGRPLPQGIPDYRNGFVPDIFPAGIGQTLAEIFDAPQVNVLALADGIVAAAALVWIGLRQRARNKAYGIEDEPRSFFIARNAIVAAAIVFVTYKLSTCFVGCPTC